MKFFNTSKVIFILVLLIFIFYKPQIENYLSYYTSQIENFLSYNSSGILNLKNDNILESQLYSINTILNNQKYNDKLYNFEDKQLKPDFDVGFIYKQQFTEYIKKEIVKILNTQKINPQFNGIEMVIMETPIKFYRKENASDYYYIFDINLFSPNKALHLHLKIYLEVVNMLKYLTPNFKYQNILPLPDTNLSIKNIKLLNTTNDITYQSLLENTPNNTFQFYQQIKNIFYLA